MKIKVLLTILLLNGCFMPCTAAEYGVARTLTPVLNVPDFRAVFRGGDGHGVKTDRCGQIRELEFVAMPGSVFTIIKKHLSGTDVIYQVETNEYAAQPNVRLYVGGRFLTLEHTAPAPRRPVLPPQATLLSALREAAGIPYVWGGNAPDGVPELAAWFHETSGGHNNNRLTLTGVDCSGLLYFASGGWTPRNTNQLITIGNGVEIAGKQSSEIAPLLQPLDLIVWKGHVIIVLDRQTVIESRLECGKPGNGGVVMTFLPQRLTEIMRTRRPANAWPQGKTRQDIFLVRRWYNQK